MTYLDTHPLHGAFLANRLDRLADLISDQGQEFLNEAGLDIPSRMVSIILLIENAQEITAAEIASTLNQPHQLVTQRIEILMNLALIERKADPGDRRRKLLVLTEKGQDQYKILQVSLAQAADVFAAMFKEIDCDLAEVAMRAIAALDRSSILDRTNRSPQQGREHD